MTTANYLFAFGIALGVVGAASPATAQCAGQSESGLCPVFIQGDPSCTDAARICGTSFPDKVFLSPPTDGPFPTSGNPDFKISVDVDGSTVRVIDLSPQDQSNGTRGYEAAIVRRNGAYIYCGISMLNDLFRSPGTGAPSQLTVCWARGPCQLDGEQVSSACNVINNGLPPATRPVDFLQTYDIGRIEQPINVCGCSPAIAQFCDVRAQHANEPTHFVACNPDGSPLKSTEAESIATEGLNSCIWMTIGGRRMLVDKDGTDPRC